MFSSCICFGCLRSLRQIGNCKIRSLLFFYLLFSFFFFYNYFYCFYYFYFFIITIIIIISIISIISIIIYIYFQLTHLHDQDHSMDSWLTITTTVSERSSKSTSPWSSNSPTKCFQIHPIKTSWLVTSFLLRHQDTDCSCILWRYKYQTKISPLTGMDKYFRLLSHIADDI